MHFNVFKHESNSFAVKPNESAQRTLINAQQGRQELENRNARFQPILKISPRRLFLTKLCQ